MISFLHLLWGWWQAIWPNLAASAITFGTGMLWHHWLVNRKLDGLRGHMNVLHSKVEALHVAVTDETGPGRHAAPESPE